MIYTPKYFDGIKQKKEFVRRCDADFDERLSRLSDAVCSETELKVFCLTGPTCSGKTTAAKKIISGFEKHRKKVFVISIDDFYYDSTKLAELAAADPNVDIDLDSEKTIDIEEFRRCADGIFSGATVRIPKFDFVQGKRTGYNEIECTENSVYIFEGIQAIYPSVTAVFGEHKYRSIYICVESSVSVGGIVFEPNEIRLMRRIVRDFYRRNSSAENTFMLWKSVRENEEKNILPYAADCDYHIDSAMAYEIGVLKPYLEKILAECNGTNAEAQKILEKIKNIEPIDSALIPENSLYREFI